MNQALTSVWARGGSCVWPEPPSGRTQSLLLMRPLTVRTGTQTPLYRLYGTSFKSVQSSPLLTGQAEAASPLHTAKQVTTPTFICH
ncbi:hypothetical protein Q5P01_013584 [Channa striata]|uniref:Uncharacterized protein n=1 Tax=Channa striata TaxID=64152 RepID=A0AA88MN73_CHASR|nr:hypothetical protein Q5P01_013584 [Channa striata]